MQNLISINHLYLPVEWKSGCLENNLHERLHSVMSQFVNVEYPAGGASSGRDAQAAVTRFKYRLLVNLMINNRHGDAITITGGCEVSPAAPGRRLD